MLLRLVLMSVFDGGLSSREIERRTRTDIAYMYLAGMQKPVYRTILGFKVDFPDLIDGAFKTTLKIAQEEDMELGEESGNSVPKSLTNKEKFHKTFQLNY